MGRGQLRFMSSKILAPETPLHRVYRGCPPFLLKAITQQRATAESTSEQGKRRPSLKLTPPPLMAAMPITRGMSREKVLHLNCTPKKLLQELVSIYWLETREYLGLDFEGA